MDDLDRPDSIVPPARRQPEPRPPHAWLAVALSLWGAGLGHAVRGRWQRGLAWSVAQFALIPLFVRAPVQMVVVGIVFRLVVIVDAVRTPATAPPPSRGKAIVLLLALLAIDSVGSRLIRRFVVEAFTIPAGSMIPTLEVGDHVYVSKLSHVPERGEVIVFHYPREPRKDFSKRVIGIPGDTVELRGDDVILNGQRLPEESLGDCQYDDFSEESNEWRASDCSTSRERLNGHEYRVIHARSSRDARDFAPVTVPPDSYYVLGDNRDNSHDSRYWGFVPSRLLVGTVKLVWFSYGPHGVRWNRVQQPVR